MRPRHERGVCVIRLPAPAVILLMALFAPHARGDELTLRQTVDGLLVFVTLSPANAVIEDPMHELERQMHRGDKPAGKIYHVLFELFEQASGTRSTDVEEVSAFVIDSARRQCRLGQLPRLRRRRTLRDRSDRATQAPGPTRDGRLPVAAYASLRAGRCSDPLRAYRPAMGQWSFLPATQATSPFTAIVAPPSRSARTDDPATACAPIRPP
jgi:hypothetical protein